MLQNNSSAYKYALKKEANEWTDERRMHHFSKTAGRGGANAGLNLPPHIPHSTQEVLALTTDSCTKHTISPMKKLGLRRVMFQDPGHITTRGLPTTCRGWWEAQASCLPILVLVAPRRPYAALAESYFPFQNPIGWG